MRPGAFAVVEVIWLWGYVFAGVSQPVHASVDEDANLDMAGLVTKYGYPIETHTVQTEDGYILTVYRIPYGRECGPNEKRKAPVLLQHGLMSSSIDFVIMGPKTSLGYILADKCYDVWLGNNRGNKQSKKHVFLKPKQKKFWAFSWHEMGVYDLPAMIDYVLNITGRPNLHYIGHSQGTTQFFVFGSLRPEYQNKIRTMHALSPVVFMKHLESPLVKGLNMAKDSLLKIVNKIGIYEIFSNKGILNVVGTEGCKNQYPKLQGICSTMMFLLCGFDEPQMNKTLLPVIIGHNPAGTGIGPVIHYAQGIDSGEFRQYDYGKENNLKIYNCKTPPKYPVDKITIPMALYYGKNDFLAALEDVKKVSRLLPNIIEDYLIPYSKFNHLDFLFGIDVKHLLYYRVLEILEKY